MNKGDVGSVVLLLCVLAFAVVIVDERLLRFLIAVVPALMLAQRAVGGAGPEEAKVGAADRRADVDTRGSIEELLRHIREFYLTCHLMGSGKIGPEVAVEKVAHQESQLNQLLARVTDGARKRVDRSL